jgi:cell division protein ZapA (FtsZ GTPase activity inhibitor)
VTVKILGQEYRIRSEAGPEHLEEVARYVDRVLRQLQERFGSDTQGAAILAALNIASDLLQMRELAAVRPDRVRSLIDLLESV